MIGARGGGCCNSNEGDSGRGWCVGDRHATNGRIDKEVRRKGGGGGASNGNDGGGAWFWKEGREVTAVQAMAISVAVLGFAGEVVAPSIRGFDGC